MVRVSKFLLFWLNAMAVAGIGCATALAVPSAAPVGEALSAEKMWSLQRLGDPTLSPDGKLAALAVTRYDVAENKSYSDLWLLPVSGGSARQLTNAHARDADPSFSPDGRWIAFVSKRGDDKESQIYVIAADGGEARRVTDLPTGATDPKWFPDGHRLAFISEIWMDLVKWEDQGRRKSERDDAKMSARSWDKAPIAYWDHFLDERERHLFSISIDGGEPLAITRQSGYHLPKNESSASSYDISPDGLDVSFESDIDRSGIDPNRDVIEIAACGCKPARDLTVSNSADDGAPLYSPDGKWLAFLQQRVKGFYASRAHVILLERASGTLRELATDWDRSAAGLRWLPDSKALLGSIDDAGTSRIYRFEVASTQPHDQPRKMTTDCSFGALAIAGNASRPVVVALRQSFIEPPTLVRLGAAGTAPLKLGDFNDRSLAAVDFGRVESVTFEGANRDPVQMWVVYPPHFDATRKYPVFMLLHGGPHNGITDAVQWRWNAQVFASWGYIVTWHNFHGSSGFGERFADSINPDRISLPYEDTIKAAQWLMNQPFVDRNRMIAGGGSYGGFLAATLLGRPHPFKALIAHAAVYDNFTQIGADYGAEKERFFNFWEKPEEFARYSPHTAAGNFVTPTLVIHGQLDRRVPLNQGIELFNILQKRGVPSKLVYFPDENHWVLKPQNSLFWYRTVRDWLQRWAPAGAQP